VDNDCIDIFHTKTGTISGMPIVASNPVTYVVTAVNFFAKDTATVVITVGVGATLFA
jgi:hypothetical protein